MTILSLTKQYLSKAFLLVMFCLPLSAMADNDIETFYKDPTYTHFIKSSESFKEVQTKHDPEAQSMALVVYAILVLDKHPEFRSKIVKDFNTFDSYQKSILYQGLIGAGFTKEANDITLQYQFKAKPNSNLTLQKINDIQFQEKIETPGQIFLQASLMDICWASYFATGDEKYIAKLVAYAKKHHGVTKENPHYIPMQAYYWSSSALSKQDPMIKEILTKLNAPQAKANRLKTA